MNWKNRLKNYNFWISMFSAVLLILQALKIEFDILYVNEIFTAVLGLLVVVGIIIDPTKTAISTKANSEDVAKRKVEINQEDKKEKEIAENSTLPIDEKDETDNVNNENDFQTVLNKISLDLENKIKELSLKNQEMAQSLREIQNNKNVEENAIKEMSLPAVAEMENPYIDLMK